MRELGDGGGLARAVDADDQDHLRAREGVDLERLGDRARGSSRSPRRRSRGCRVLVMPRSKRSLGQPRRGSRAAVRGAEIGGDQRLLDLVERRRRRARALVNRPARLSPSRSEVLRKPPSSRSCQVVVAHAGAPIRMSSVDAGDRARATMLAGPARGAASRTAREILGMAASPSRSTSTSLRRADQLAAATPPCAAPPPRAAARRAPCTTLARDLRHARGGRAGAGRIGEDVARGRCRNRRSARGCWRHRLVLGREAGDQVGADRDVRAAPP